MRAMVRRVEWRRGRGSGGGRGGTVKSTQVVVQTQVEHGRSGLPQGIHSRTCKICVEREWAVLARPSPPTRHPHVRTTHHSRTEEKEWRDRGQGTHRLLGVLEENLCTVWDTELLLCLCACAVDTRGGLCRVATHEPVERCVKIIQPEIERGRTYGCLSRRRTFAPRSRSVCAAERPARPPPTTMTCAIVL